MCGEARSYEKTYQYDWAMADYDRGDPARPQSTPPPTTMRGIRLLRQTTRLRPHLGRLQRGDPARPQTRPTPTSAEGECLRRPTRLRPRPGRLQRGDPARPQIWSWCYLSRRGDLYHEMARSTTAPWPTSTRRSGSTPKYAAAYRQPGVDLRLHQTTRSTTAPWPTTTRRSGSTPRWPPSTTNRGYIYDGRRDYDRALADFNEAIRLDPNAAPAYFKRGIIYDHHRGDYDRALADYNEAIRLDPKYADAYELRAVIYLTKRGDLDRALADFNEAIRLHPESASPTSAGGRPTRPKAMPRVPTPTLPAPVNSIPI